MHDSALRFMAFWFSSFPLFPCACVPRLLTRDEHCCLSLTPVPSRSIILGSQADKRCESCERVSNVRDERLWHPSRECLNTVFHFAWYYLICFFISCWRFIVQRRQTIFVFRVLVSHFATILAGALGDITLIVHQFSLSLGNAVSVK